MKITGQYINTPIYHTEYKSYTPSFGISFKMPALLSDIFEKHTACPVNGVTKIKNLRPGRYGTECQYSTPLEPFEYSCGLKEIKGLYKKGLSTNNDAWADAFLKSSADTPISTSSVHDCSVMYLFNKDTNTHFLYHSYYNMEEDEFIFLIKNFMSEGFSSAEILPGSRTWYMRHFETLPVMLQAIKASNKKAVVNVRHYSSKLPEVVGYKGHLYEIPNDRIALGFSDKGQASFKICDVRAKDIMEEIESHSQSHQKLEMLRKWYAEKGFDKEILNVINGLLDKMQSLIP